MRLYKAELRIVKSDIGFFCQKQLLSKKPIGNYIGGLSNEVTKIRKGIYKDMYYYPILQTLHDYFRNTRYSEEKQRYSIEELIKLGYQEKLIEEVQESSNYHYWENRFLVVSKQFPHKAKEITTGFTFPIVKSFLDDSASYKEEWIFEKFFQANQRVYVNILGEMSNEEFKQFADRINDDINKRKQTLSFIMEDTKKDWRSFPSSEEMKKFISQTQFMRELQEILENRKQTELERKETKQYVKMIEKMRNSK